MNEIPHPGFDKPEHYETFTTTNGLEEAADEYEKKHTYQRYDGGGLTPEYNATLAEAFIAGYNLCKEQMMTEEAIEGEVMTNGFYPYEPRIVAPYPNCPYDFGDKVRVIVVKE